MSERDRGNTLRVMTWNVWGIADGTQWEERQAGIESVLVEQDPDIVFLQEARAEHSGDRQPERLAAALGGFHAAWPLGQWEGRDGWFGNAVLSRWPVISTSWHPLHRLNGGTPWRHMVEVVVDSPWGPWPMISTHFEYPFDQSAQRQLSARELMQLVAHRQGEKSSALRRLPVIVGADLNAVPDSDEVHILTGRSPGVRGVVFSDVWEIVGAGGRLGEQGVTWNPRNPHLANTAWPNRRLDYLLVSWPRPKPIGNPIRAWIAGDQPVNGRYPSDHFAVVADIRAGRPPEKASDSE